MLDAFGAVSFITGLLPIGKAFAFAQFLPVAFKVLGIVAGIDANHDGTWSGEEKMAAAKLILVQMARSIPGLGGLDIDRAGRILDHAVGLLNELTHNSAVLAPAPQAAMPPALNPSLAGKLQPPMLSAMDQGMGVGLAAAVEHGTRAGTLAELEAEGQRNPSPLTSDADAADSSSSAGASSESAADDPFQGT